jgi:hypothetical protein
MNRTLEKAAASPIWQDSCAKIPEGGALALLGGEEA